jgi:hypothetical protein
VPFYVIEDINQSFIYHVSKVARTMNIIIRFSDILDRYLRLSRHRMQPSDHFARFVRLLYLLARF